MVETINLKDAQAAVHGDVIRQDELEGIFDALRSASRQTRACRRRLIAGATVEPGAISCELEVVSGRIQAEDSDFEWGSLDVDGMNIEKNDDEDQEDEDTAEEPAATATPDIKDLSTLSDEELRQRYEPATRRAVLERVSKVVLGSDAVKFIALIEYAAHCAPSVPVKAA